MRTTLTLDDDVAQLLDEAVHRDHRSMKHVVNDAIRQALAPRPTRQQPYRLTTHESSVRPGFDLTGLNGLVDEMEDDAIMAVARRER